MSGVKHTPGRWVAGWNGGLTGPTTASSAGPCAAGRNWGFYPVARGMDTIAICPNASLGREPDDQAIANARLIAAAPDLLEALEQLLGNAEIARFHLKDTEEGMLVGSALFDTIQQARARGEQEGG